MAGTGRYCPWDACARVGICGRGADGFDQVRPVSLEQVANVATLPGILGSSIAMPDIHWGYGFPVGGVAATDGQDGVVSPGGIGFDINCGVTAVVDATRRGRSEGKGS